MAAPGFAGTVVGEPLDAKVKTIAVAVLNEVTIAVLGSADGTVRLWDLATGDPYGKGLTGPAKGAESIAIATIGGRTLVVSGHWDGTLWTRSP